MVERAFIIGRSASSRCSWKAAALIAAHDTSLRGLVKYIENISDADIEQVEIPTGTFSLIKV